MLRNVLSKLPALASLTESYRPPTAKAVSRSLSPRVDAVLRQPRPLRRNEDGKVSRRSSSVPSPTKKYEQYNYVKSKNIIKDRQEDGDKYASKREPTEVCSEMTYELEAAKPKRSKSCVDFDVFKQVENQKFEQDMLVYLQPSMLKPFGSSQSYTPNTFSSRAQSYTTPTFKMNEVMEGTRKINDDARDAISEGARRTFSTNSVPLCYTRKELDSKPMETAPESISEEASAKPLEKLYTQKKVSATRLTQETEANINDADEFVAEPNVIGSSSRKEHIFDPAIDNMIAAKNMKWYNEKLEDVSINPPPFLGCRHYEEPVFPTSNKSSRVIDENRLTPPFPCFSERFKYNTTETIVGTQAEMLPKEKAMDRQQMQSSKKGVDKMQRRAISTTEGPTMMKSGMMLAAKGKRYPTPYDCPAEEKKEPPKERTTPDGQKCFLPSAVRLKVPECMPRPKHICPPPPCVRADECLAVMPKKLPYIPDGPCVCVEPEIPTIAPPIKRLNLTVKEPPRVCPTPLCPQPRADDNMPHKPRQLKPYVPKPCACVEPPPMIDVPLKRLPPKCPPEDPMHCQPERICPEEVCVRADHNLCVKPKRLPVLQPKDCPCIEPEPMTDVRLKRLDLSMPEPPRVCPCVEDCPCPRADDNLKPKVKKLRKIVPGDCPCIEPTYRDVNFKRLECIDEPEPCDVTDPCIPYPRADYGCWEYYNPPDPCIAKRREAKKPKPRRMINAKPSQRCYRVEPRKKTYSAEKLKSNTLTRLAKSKLDKVQEAEKKQSSSRRNPPVKHLIRSKVETMPGNSNTIDLIDRLKDIQRQSSNNIVFDPPKSSKIDMKKIMSTISMLEKESVTTKGATVRNLSTTLVPRPPSTAPAQQSRRKITTTKPTSKKGDDKCSVKQKFCTRKPKLCPRGNCPVTPIDNCPTGERRPFCSKKKAVDCCEKPSSPYPSFSELMDEQIEPFSEHTEWTCKRREYGFYPKTTKEFEPLNTKKNKKCFSTLSFNVKELLDQPPDDLKSARGVLTGDSQVAGATSQRLDNGKVHILYRKESREPKCIAKHSSSRSVNCHIIRNTVSIPHEESRTRLLKQKSNYGIVGISNSPLDVVGCHLVQSCPTTNIRNKSSMSNHSFIRNHSSQNEKDKKTSVRICRIQHEKPCTKEKCPKFEFVHCPPKVQRDCNGYMPLCCKKREAPYRAFSDCLTEELQEELSECPQSREALQQLQPVKKQAPIEDIPLMAPREPDIGKIDLAKETKCVRRVLCIENKGLSQDCSNFGQPMRALKSKELLADHYKSEDCLAIEKEKREREKKATQTKFKCYNEGFGNVKRHYSTKASRGGARLGSKKEGVDDKESITKRTKEKNALTLVISPRKIYMRAFHALRKKTSSQTEAADSKNQNHIPFPPLPLYDDDPIQFTRLRNAQWRIDNFNRWRRLSNLYGTIKRNYSSFEHCGQISQSQQLSTSVVSSHYESMTELSRCHDVSAPMIFAKSATTPKFGAKKVVKRYTASNGGDRKKGNYCNTARKVQKCSSPISVKVRSAPRIAEADMKRLQPQYPILPEIDCNEDKQPCPFQHCIDTSMDVEYLRQKFGIKNEGLTQDCSTFGQPINKHMKYKELVKAASTSACCGRNTGGGRSGASDDDDDCNRPKKLNCQDVIAAAQGNKRKECEDRETEDTCVITKEERVVRKEEKRYIKAKRDPCEKKKDVCTEEKICEKIVECCEDVEDPCEKKPVCKESLWRKIVNYFKARPGCPPPDEWKKKALRDKAERAAKAAGLIVCDPKDLPAEFICKCKSLPTVITPKCEEQKVDECECECDEDEDKDPCSSTVKKQKVSGHKKCSTTTMTSVGKRCFSSKANSKVLEEINKSLEEAEKKELAKKIVQTVNQMLNGNDGVEETEGNIDPTDGAVNNNTATADNNKANRFNRNLKVDKARADLSYRTHIVRKGYTPHFLDVIFHDKAEDELTGYHRARAFAAFQEYFSKIDTVSEINHDDMEKAKTKKLLSELDKLLEDTKKKS